MDEREKPISALTAEADKDDGKTVNFDSYRPKSPSGASPCKKKGYGLRKWRRIKRDVVKDSSPTSENSKVLKRVLPGSANSHTERMHLPSPQLEQRMQDSLGSVSHLKNVGAADGFDTAGSGLDSRFAFSAGLDPENSDGRSSKSSTAASSPKVRYDSPTGHSWDKQRAKYLGGKTMMDSGDRRAQQGKTRVENSKKPRGERVKIEEENSRSSVESDSRSSNFVFMQGVFCSSSSRKQSGKVMDYNGENSDDGHTKGETSCRKDNTGDKPEDLSQEDSAAESINKNNCSSVDQDPLTESINSFLTLQEDLEREIQKFREIGKEPMGLHHGPQHIGSIHATREHASETSSSNQFEIPALVKNIEYLEVKLGETRSMLEVKELRIHELESLTNLNKHSGEEVVNTSESQQEGYRGRETEAEEAFQTKVEAEIECLILSRSIENLKTVSETHEVLSKLREAETKASILKIRAHELEKHCGDIVEALEVKSIKKRACKTYSCLLLQLVLLLIVFSLFISQILPESEIVVPT